MLISTTSERSERQGDNKDKSRILMPRVLILVRSQEW